MLEENNDIEISAESENYNAEDISSCFTENEEISDTSCASCEIPENKTAQPKRSFISNLIDYLEIFVFSICFVIIMFSFLARICQVKGPSMEKTLYQGEALLVSNLFYEPQRNDIIVFHQTGMLNEPVVKRVIATAGETIDIDFNTWTVTITDTNGDTFVLEEDYMYLDGGEAYIRSNFSYPMEIPEGMMFVMGDNRNHSSDSRGYIIGLVDERRVIGKVIFRLSPIDRIGTVK